MQAYNPDLTGIADSIYRRKVASEGLFAVAFFGAQGSRSQHKRCNTLWRASMREAARHGKRL